MKTIKKNVYYCGFCNKHGLSIGAMRYHETVCFNNPENARPCFGCLNLEKKATTIYGDYPNGNNWERSVNLLYCKANKTFLYTPKNEVKGNVFDLGDDENNPMPKECELLNKSWTSLL